MAQRGRKKLTALNSATSSTSSGSTVDWKGVRVPSSLDEIGKMFWSVLVARLRTAGTLTRTDPALVELACRAYSTVRACHKAMDQDGLFFEAPNMTLMAHPGSKVAAQAETRLARILKELGLTPGSKVAAPAETKDDSDPWKGLLSVTG